MFEALKDRTQSKVVVSLCIEFYILVELLKM